MKYKLLSILLFSTVLAFGQGLKREYIGPHDGYSDAVIVTNDKIKTIYIAGQVGEGTDLEQQLRVAFQRLNEQLGKSGADFKDVVKHTTYIKNYKDKDLVAFRKVRKEMFGHLEFMPPNVLVGVTALFREDILVEMDAIAMIPADN